MKTPVWIVAGVTSLMLGTSLQPVDIYAAVSDPSAQTFEITKGVIVDPGSGVVYLMNREHGIDAIELASGNAIWRSTSAAEPLLLFDGRLVAQAEASAGNRVLPIVVMNTAHGELVQSATVPLPRPAYASIDDAMGSSFTADAYLSGGEVEVSWRFAQRAGLARPGPAPVPEITGAARIDLKTGQVQVLPASNSATQRRASPAAGAPGDIQLEPGFNFAIASADGQMILANKPAGTDASGWTDYLWAIYSLQTRERLGEVRMPTSAAPFFMWNTKLVYVSRPYGRRIDGKWIQEPLELRAVDLRTGRELWKTPIRDTTYHGPFPPRP
jgi:hypothetical protein